eukprot:1789174-Prymnesium_polylepis.1
MSRCRHTLSDFIFASSACHAPDPPAGFAGTPATILFKEQSYTMTVIPLQRFVEPGMRVRFLSPDTQEPRCTTLSKLDGLEFVCTIDNSDQTISGSTRATRVHAVTLSDGNEVSVALEVAPPRYTAGERLLVAVAGRPLIEANVVSSPNFDRATPTRHALSLPSSSDGGELSVDLNPFNHCRQRLASLVDYFAVIKSYCGHLESITSELEAAITSSKMRTLDQVLAIEVRTTGVTRAGYSDAPHIAALCEPLLAASPERPQGTHTTQPGLACAAPGTGKYITENIQPSDSVHV